MAIREVHADLIGHLVTLRAMVRHDQNTTQNPAAKKNQCVNVARCVTASRSVCRSHAQATFDRPARVITDSCDTCGYETYQEVATVLRCSRTFS